MKFIKDRDELFERISIDKLIDSDQYEDTTRDMYAKYGILCSYTLEELRNGHSSYPGIVTFAKVKNDIYVAFCETWTDPYDPGDFLYTFSKLGYRDIESGILIGDILYLDIRASYKTAIQYIKEYNKIVKHKDLNALYSNISYNIKIKFSLVDMNDDIYTSSYTLSDYKNREDVLFLDFYDKIKQYATDNKIDIKSLLTKKQYATLTDPANKHLLRASNYGMFK